MDQFHHTRLTTPRSIRLLHLQPAQELTSALKFSLTEASLDADNLSYEALSYVWGARTGTIPVNCCSQTLLVTPNCESALRYLRLSNVIRVLWIDAICIDQENGTESLKERDTQITLMGDVYSHARQTLCWFGEGYGFTAKVFERLQRFGEFNSGRELVKLLAFDDQLRQKGDLGKDESCLNHIFCHPWHSRIWTVQEVAYSVDCLVLSGRATIPWTTYSNAAIHLMYETEIDALDPQAIRSCASIDARVVLRNSITEFQDINSASSEHLEKRNTFLTSCLSEVRYLQATNPKDKIYGLYALFTTMNVPLPVPDYKKSLSEVYEEATVAFIAYTQSLEVLRVASSNLRNSNLPTWVPDWQDESTNLYTPYMKATKGSRIGAIDRSLISPLPGQLNIMGRELGTIVQRSENDFAPVDIPAHAGHILPILTEDRYDFMEEIDTLRLLIHRVKTLREWLRMIASESYEPSSADEDSEEEDVAYTLLTSGHFDLDTDVFDLLMDLLLEPTSYDLSIAESTTQRWKDADQTNTTNWSPELTECSIISAWIASKFTNPEDDDPKGAEKLLGMVAKISGYVNDQALVVIQPTGDHKFLLGTAFHPVRVGDTVTLLRGADFPVVIRAAASNWSLIGPAVVADAMDGEAWPEDELLSDFILI